MSAGPRKNPGIKRPYIPLPDVLAPAGEVCITIPVPDHPDHKRALLSVLNLLGNWGTWGRTGSDDGAQAAAVWKEKLERIVWDGGECVSPEIDQCVDYMPSSSRIDYEPANPFTEAGTIPPGYIGEPFTIVKETDAGLLLLGFIVGDVMTDLTRYPGGATAPEIIASGLPRFILTYTAPAEIEFHFVQFPGGGRAIIRRDFDINPLAWTGVELNKDLFSVPAETVTEIVIEFNDEDTGIHTYEVSFVPNVDDSIPYIFFGGGLRKITICNEGGESDESMPTKIRLNPDDNCIIQVSYDNETSWEDAIDLENTCGPDVRRIRQNPDNPCQLQYSPFGEPEEGEEDVWFVVADFNLCKPTLRWRGGILEWFDGDEWIPFDDIDPIYDDPPPPVPRPEEEPNDKRCSAAASAAYAYVDLANRLYGLLNVTPTPFPTSVTADYAGIVSNTLNFFMGTDAFTNLVANAVFQVNVLSYITDLGLGMGGAAAELISVLDLTNPDMRDKIKCALYCAMSEVGNVAAEDAFAAIDDAIDNDGLASGWSRFIELFGAGGVNAAMSVGAFSVPASDCDCDCPVEWCYQWLGGEGFADWTLVSGTYNSGLDRIEGIETAPSPDNTNEIALTLAYATAQVTEFYIEFDYKSAPNTYGGNYWAIGDGTTIGTNSLDSVVPAPLNEEGTRALGWTGDAPSSAVWIGLGTPSRDGDAYTHLKLIRMRGTGENPFGEDNCDEE